MTTDTISVAKFDNATKNQTGTITALPSDLVAHKVCCLILNINFTRKYKVIFRMTKLR